ncbi:TVP38/TMEM64 family protein [Pacificimonas sp. WHA3]|uniref:TVP38/TMEM64 family membrane protein n=1 Tax=Pacificimonas pallii TaxID=2827236 RepID=A0ABS6SD20_9SPHN|nr:TVP38/TMEM64 family protein [Pacificimonas pallii]MBV7256314.1 TVP38/TMEM64 family protein [Pacificimonas pallii]
MTGTSMTPDSAPAISPIRRFGPLAILVIGLAAFFSLGGAQYLSLDYLSAQYGTLTAYVADNIVVAAIAFAVLYTLVVAISVPGAAPLTIAGGLLFGTLLGGSLTVIGATVGAIIVFLAARTALADLLRRKAGPRVTKLRDGFEKNAFNYLLFLRLVPAFPFFLVNIAAGLFGMRTLPYAAATGLGIIPGTFVFASIGAGAGAVIARGDELSLSGILTDPKVLLPIIGLAALALLPIMIKRFRSDATGAGAD